MNTNLEYNVTCGGCRNRWNAFSAGWCGCAGGRLSLSCPSCGRCFCRAPEAAWNSFWLTAPAELIHRRSNEQRRRLDSTVTLLASNRPTVMIVDDDEEMRMLIMDFVGQMGYRTITARDAEEALSILPEWKPDVVITDALMPRMDGREMCRHIKASDPSIKVIIMTSLYTGLRYRNEAFRTFRADEFLPKPVDFARLHEILGRFAPLSPDLPRIAMTGQTLQVSA